jgi:2,3-bisphosphoglycerate-independent phosphoglycerate mutase
VHSHEDHIHAMVELARQRGAKKIYLHAFLDGRDTPPRSAAASIESMQQLFDKLGGGRFASIIGRYYAMDRDHRWPRIQAAYDLITQGKAEFESLDAMSALEMAYARDESDEFVKATAIVPAGKQPVCVEEGDVMIFMNYRSDRARQITRPFIEPDFDGFVRECEPKLGSFVSLTEYKSDFDVPVAYPAERLKNVFGEYVAKNGLRQLRLAELVKSPMVPTYDLQPEMSATEVTDNLVAAIESGTYDVIVCNYANPDMVGHTGKFDAAVQAIEALDSCLGRIVEALDNAGGEMLVTADHGNAELMLNVETGQAYTAHTTNPVPLIYIGRPAQLQEHGALSDIAPTMLYLMNMPLPPEMTGTPLVELLADVNEDSEQEAAADVHD